MIARSVKRRATQDRRDRGVVLADGAERTVNVANVGCVEHRRAVLRVGRVCHFAPPSYAGVAAGFFKSRFAPVIHPARTRGARTPTLYSSTCVFLIVLRGAPDGVADSGEWTA